VACRRFSLLLPAGRLIGVFIDGDLCRIIDHKVQPALVKNVMTADCKTIYSGMLAAEVLQIMDSTRIDALPAVNAENELVGALDMHDLLRVGVV
jgi:arabinose-5-phosphate isomerase